MTGETEQKVTALEAAPGQLPLPRFDVQIRPPDIADWLTGNTGVPGFTSFTAAEPGPHVMLVAVNHGNELVGAIVLDRLMRAGLRPKRGRLTIGFANIDAYARFDPTQPTASRFVDEDLNRVWSEAVLDGPRQSSELDRARQMRPLIDTADLLLDLHSMLWPSEPLILSGCTAKGRTLAHAVGAPGLVVADSGHVSGKRLMDYGRFADEASPQVAVLVEAGQHWLPSSVDMAAASVVGLLHHVGMADASPLLMAPPPQPDRRFAAVTQVVTAATASFAFVQQFGGGEVVPQRNTLIAMDGSTEIRTPYDDCLLVMPSLRPGRGHTAVRLARMEPV